MSDGWETECLVLFVVSPLLGVLAEVIGCAILNAAGHSGYMPLYLAARMGAFGAPIAAVACVFIYATLIDNVTLTEDEIELLAREGGPFSRLKLIGDLVLVQATEAWGFAAPYAICVAGPPIGSGLFASIGLSRAITPLHAVRAGAIGGILAVPIYFGIVFGLNFATSQVILRFFEDRPIVPGGGDDVGIGPDEMRERASVALEEELLDDEARLAEGELRNAELIRRGEAFAQEDAFLRRSAAAREREEVEAQAEAEIAAEEEEVYMRKRQLEEEEMLRAEELRSHLGSGSRAGDPLPPRVEMRQHRRPYPPPRPYVPLPPPSHYRPPASLLQSRPPPPMPSYRRR